MATQTRLNISQFLAGDWPADTQLVDGEVIVNDPSFRHQRITLRLVRALDTWVAGGEERGEAGFGGNWTVAPGQVYKPDGWWTPAAARPSAEALRSDIPPALVVEVRSPGTWHLDVGRKRAVYEQVGVGELWLVDTPARSVLVYRRSQPNSDGFDLTDEVGPGATLTTPLLHQFSLAIDDLFAD